MGHAPCFKRKAASLDGSTHRLSHYDRISSFRHSGIHQYSIGA
jgi:hypothetical protein